MDVNIMQGEPPTMTLQQQWEELSAPLFAEDGNNPEFPYDIVGNPELAQTLRGLSELYLPQCERKFKLLHEKRLVEKAFLEDQADPDDTLRELEDIDADIEQFDRELVQTNARSIRRLKSSPGFPETDKPEIGVAVALLSPVIKKSVAAACIHSGYIVDVGDDPRLINAVKTTVPRSLG